jgi:hypothetical protein
MRNCSFCGETGHNKLTCWLVELSQSLLPDTETTPRKTYCCSICREPDHNSATCGKKDNSSSPKKAPRNCKRCGEAGHNRRTCLIEKCDAALASPTETTPRKTYCCSICGESGHNSQSCGKKDISSSPKKAPRHCKRCGESGHNTRTCSVTDDLLTILEPLCLPCSPSSPKTYKRRILDDTHTINQHYVPTADPCSPIVFG